MQNFDFSNRLFVLAADLVNHTCRDVFLTGKAGSGKTTFLKFIKENCPKQMAVVAPTGVAAINAGGVTIHSFFQLPLAPFIPQANGFSPNGGEVSDRHSLLARMRLNTERRKVLQELELLIIDEISMVRCDVLDAVDVVLRYVRHRPSERFGGVQVLLVGDLFQLPPVVRGQEWQLLSEYYASPYFFESHVMKESPPVCIEFTKIYRQTEERFIGLLNMVRNNQLDYEHMQLLHERYQPQFFGNKSDGYILLTTHNEKAREINTSELNRLPGKTFSYKAAIDGEFPSTAFPADEMLQLKVGAQVMFIRNDVDKARRFFNGKIGVVTGFEGEKIFVECNDGSPVIEVVKESWKNIRYTLDKKSRKIDEDVLGSFSQYPLRLAWAITIHKSQGLTFEKAVIDAGRAFAPGQVYVALSRCISLDGLVLHSRIEAGSLSADQRILEFTQNSVSPEALGHELVKARKAFQEKTVAELFDFRLEVNALKELTSYVREHGGSFNKEVIPWLSSLLEQLVELKNTGQKFQFQLNSLFSENEVAGENELLKQRMRAASEWFHPAIGSVVKTVLGSPARTDSSQHAKSFNGHLKEVFVQLSFKQFMIRSLDENLDMEAFYRRKKSFVVPPFMVNAYGGVSNDDVPQERRELYWQLKEVRDQICERRGLPVYLVAGSHSLEEMATYLPQTTDELQKISGFGSAKAERFGPDFLSIINSYCVENKLSSNIAAKKQKRRESKRGKPDTRAESYRLFRQGRSVSEIAKERNLTASTIENHLAHFVRGGDLDIEELISSEKLSLLQPAADEYSGGSIVPIKQKLGDRVSFGEIRFALAWAEFKKSSSHINH